MSIPPEVSSELFQLIAEFTYDWETWVDREGRTRWINAAVTRITGYEVAECQALPDYPLALACDADRATLAHVIADARAGGSGNDVEFRILTKAKSLRWVAISWQAVRGRSGDSFGYRTSVRDIDERKRLEGELHALRRRAEGLAMARSTLLANVSHELRSPAHCIAGFAELLLREPLAQKTQHYVTLIAEQARGMLRHAEDLLSLTALEAGGVTLRPEPVDLVHLVEAALSAYAPVALLRGLTLRSELALATHWVELDGLRLAQILRNLIDNALKFTERGEVVVRVRREREGEAARLVLEVADTGMGMEPDQIEPLLLPFRQAQGGARQQGGVGLGLAIVERLVRAMEGQLKLDSAPGRGTSVRVALPWVDTNAPRQQDLQSDADELNGTALVVDDSDVARELLCELLASCGFASVQAASLDAARSAALTRPFDVAFVDYQLPGSDGAELAHMLRRTLSAAAEGRKVPIFILTANVFVHEQLHEARASIDGVLTKPLSRASLLRLLRGLALEPRVRDAEPTIERSAGEPVIDTLVVSDLQTTRARSGESLLQKLLPRVRADVQASLAEARAHLSLDDRPALARAAHALAGHSGLIGARRAADLAQQLELTCQSDAEPVRATLLAQLAAYAQAWQEAEPRLEALARES